MIYYFPPIPTTIEGYAVITMVAALTWTLPWCLKQAGLWDALKKWYKYLLAGILLIYPASFIYAMISNLGFWTNYIFAVMESIALILGTIGILGMCKKLLLK